ncbi:MAG: SGNH/GDSL hydrolase family protein [Clostridia bacterium]|nr:SGNH/GDSL hydrolase family protein [Clostridia bacterium]
MKSKNIFILLLLALLCAFHGASAIAGDIDAGHSPVTKRMSVRGDAGAYNAGENITLLLLTDEADEKNYTYDQIGYVEQGKVSQDGTYNFSFKFSGDTDKYKLLMNLAGKNVTDTVKKATAKSDLFDVKLTVNKYTDTAEAVAEIENRYGIEAESYRLILVFYDGNQKMLGIKIGEAGTVLSDITTDRIDSDIPAGTESVKAMLWDDTESMIPLCTGTERGKQAIVCWGDSLTAGTGGNIGIDGVTSVIPAVTYPRVLAELSGREVINMGVGGETATTIAARQGGLNMLVSACTIPADRVPVKVELIGSNGTEVAPLKQDGTGKSGVNPCYINDIEGKLTLENNEYYFTRTTAGKAYSVPDRAPIVTQGMLTQRDKIAVIFIGTNGGFGNDWTNFTGLTDIYDSMINFLDYEQKEYVIVGLTTQGTAERGKMEQILSERYGNRFINMREYLTSSESIYEEKGITLSDDDRALMAAGKVPACIRIDGVHFNSVGYRMLGEKIYSHMTEIGILKQ